MIKSLYSGVSGMKNHQVRMDVVANNIANVNTTAFKAGRVTFKDILSQTVDGNQIGRGMMVSSIDNVNTQGSLTNTGIATDLFIQGNGYFIVQDPNDADNLYYTRDGSFHIDDAGNLVNSSGYQVCDDSGEAITGITVPIDSITIDTKGLISIYPAGSTEAEEYQIGLATFNDLSRLLKKGDNLFQYDMSPNTDGSDPSDAIYGIPGEIGLGQVISNNLELSNVDLTTEFTNMITTQRGYQANSKIITTSDEMLQEILTLKR